MGLFSLEMEHDSSLEMDVSPELLQELQAQVENAMFLVVGLNQQIDDIRLRCARRISELTSWECPNGHPRPSISIDMTMTTSGENVLKISACCPVLSELVAESLEAYVGPLSHGI